MVRLILGTIRKKLPVKSCHAIDYNMDPNTLYSKYEQLCVLKGKKFGVLSTVQKNRAVTRSLVAWVTPD